MDNAVDIIFRTRAELAGARATEEQLQRQIGQAKALGNNYDDLEKKLQRVQATIKSSPTPAGPGMGEMFTKIREGLGDIVPGFAKLDGIMGKFAGGALGAIAGGFAAVAAALTGAKAALDKFASVEQTVAKLDAALAQAGLLSDSYREKLQGLAHGSEQWLGVLTRLTQFDAKPENIEAYMQSVKDLAGILGGDIEQAAHIFSIALQGNFEMLHRYGIRVDESKTKTEQLADAQAQMAQHGRGQLDAANEGIAGGFRKVAREGGNLLEGFGRIIASSGVVQAATDALSTAFGFWAEKIGGLVPKLDALQNKYKPIGMSALEAADQQKKFADQLNAVETAAKGAATGLAEYLSQLDQTKSLEDQRDDAQMKLELGGVDLSGATGSNALAQKAKITQKFATRKFEREQALDQQKIDAFATDSSRATEGYREADAAVKRQQELIEKQKTIERAGANAQDADNRVKKAQEDRQKLIDSAAAANTFAGQGFAFEKAGAPAGLADADASIQRAQELADQAHRLVERLGPGVKGKSAADIDRELRERLIPEREKAGDRLRESVSHDKDVDSLKERQKFRGETFGASSAAELISQSVQISNSKTEEANKAVQEALKAKDAGIVSAFNQTIINQKQTAAAIQQVMKELSGVKEIIKNLRQPP